MSFGQATDLKALVPFGGGWFVQEMPLVEVIMIVEPEPMFPELPIAIHASLFQQEMPVRSTALGGGDSIDQVDPVFDV
jgi:hypothetical protein